MPPKKKMRSESNRRDWKKKRGGRNKKPGNRARAPGDDSRGAGYKDIIKENERFVKYYQGLGLIPAEEWDIFMAVIREPLPATFRITGTRLMAEHVKKCLQKKFFSQLSEMTVEGERVPPATPLSWYPNELAWHVPLTRKFIRKSPLMSKFHSFLVKESEQGNISRQEAVSMIPPLLLDVKPHHKVLDMCAAPGSKTAQLIEALHAEDTTESSLPAGAVIANDADNKRCYMLVHQAKRLNSPCFIVTNHDASVFPMFYYHTDSNERLPLFYDRVLCDVPCSGDGTLRKNPTIWREWNPSVAQSLHKLQLRILTRGLELLSPGGRLVYSTCSLNPAENEAVIATMLQLSKDSVSLVDCSSSLPGLKRVPGLTNWKVMTKSCVWYSSPSEVPEASLNQLPESLFPPSPSDPVTPQLSKCIRVLPHHQDSGGFFIALLEKKEWLPWQKQRKQAGLVSKDSSQSEQEAANETTVNSLESPNEADTNGPISEQTTIGDHLQPTGDNAMVEDQSVAVDMTKPAEPSPITEEPVTEIGAQEKNPSQAQASSAAKTDEEDRPSKDILGRASYQKRRLHGYKEDPYVFLSEDNEVQQAIQSYYGMRGDFPYDQLLTRSLIGKKRNVYLSSKLVKELTIRNENAVKIINIGVRLLARYDRQTTACTFRICQEGVESILPYVSARVVPVSQEDLVCVLAHPNPLSTALSQPAQQALAALEIGPVLFKYTPTNDPPSDASDKFVLFCPITLTGWRAAKSVRLFVDKIYRYHFLSMLGEEPQENQLLDCVSAQDKDITDGGPGGESPQDEGESLDDVTEHAQIEAQSELIEKPVQTDSDLPMITET